MLDCQSPQENYCIKNLTNWVSIFRWVWPNCFYYRLSLNIMSWTSFRYLKLWAWLSSYKLQLTFKIAFHFKVSVLQSKFGCKLLLHHFKFLSILCFVAGNFRLTVLVALLPYLDYLRSVFIGKKNWTLFSINAKKLQTICFHVFVENCFHDFTISQSF